MKKNIFKRIEKERKLPIDLKDQLLDELPSLEEGLDEEDKPAEKSPKKN